MKVLCCVVAFRYSRHTFEMRRVKSLLGGLFLLACAGLMLWAGLSRMEDDGFGPKALADAQSGQSLLLILAVPVALAGVGAFSDLFSKRCAVDEQD